jgi:hypothetical protein
MSGAVPDLPLTCKPKLCEQGQLCNTLQLMQPRPESGCSTTDEKNEIQFAHVNNYKHSEAANRVYIRQTRDLCFSALHTRSSQD